jgi:site-specific DNA-methyltransferase (cytosine-N4-specific)
MVAAPKFDQWEITAKGRTALREAKPGVVITIYESNTGVALWADCRDAFSHVAPGTVQAIITSPPYSLLRQKDYGNFQGTEYVDWLTDLAAGWKKVLADDGSLFLNLGDCWEKGHPSLSLYAERVLLRLVDDLGFRLAQRFEWHNPSKMPAPAEWVCVKRVRVKSSLEKIYWLSKGDFHPYADNRGVLTPYSDSMRRRIATGGEKSASRPSGHTRRDGAFGVDMGGAIPGNLLIAANTESNSAYQTACRQAGLPIHPARFPSLLPEHFINLATRPNDIVADPFGGSFTTAAAAQKLGRKFITCEKSLTYALGGLLRIGGQAPLHLLDARESAASDLFAA